MAAAPRTAQLAAAEVGALRVEGVLAADAVFGMTPSSPPRGRLSMLIETGRGLPLSATQDVGEHPSQHIAASTKQRLLRRGTVVTVYARGITFRHDHHLAVGVLEGVTDVVPQLPPNPRS